MVVDDSETILLEIRERLRYAGVEYLITCNDSRQAMGMMSEHPVGVLVLDLVMPHISGEELLGKILQEYPDIPVIVLTGTDDVGTAVRCMKLGAFDYVIKGENIRQLENAVSHALEIRELARENERLMQQMQSHELENPQAFERIITRNRKMLSIFQYIETVAPALYPVLITGETGVGKELIAGSLHKASGREGKMVPVNLAGLDDTMFSDTLFGHLKGAYTGAVSDRRGLIEQAAGGTLFLDEIGDMSPDSQVKLLRLLQEGEYLPLGCDKHRHTDTRIVAATNKDLWKLQEEGQFREDLIDAVVQDRCGMLSPDIIRSYMTKMQEKEEVLPFAHLKRLPTLKQASDMLIDEAIKRSREKQGLAAKLLGITQPTLSGRLKNRRKAG